jgi:phosphatidylglycerol---prolipoprotein diacylglyceryl transferase
MFPELFSIGSFSLRTFTVFAVSAFFLSAFVFWRKSREEHYPEDNIFDIFLLSTLIGIIAARAGYILFHFDQFGFSFARWLDTISNAGFNGQIGIMLAGISLYQYAEKKKWDAFEILDFWTMAITLGLSIIYLGQLFAGTGVGYPTGLPVGMHFPGLFEPVHPAQLYQAVFYAGLYWYLSKVEFKYRNFQWYRSGKKSAQTGFLVSVALLSSGIYMFILSFLKPPTIELFSIDLDRVFAVLMAIVGGLLLYHRSGRPLPFTRELKKRKKLTERIRVQ